MTNRNMITMLVVAMVTVLANSAHAAIITTTDTGSGGRNDGPYTIGNLIEVGGSPVSINALGVQDRGADGYDGGSVDVGLWSADGLTLHRSVTVVGTDTLGADNYRYASVAEFTLLANTSYLIGATVGDGLEPFVDLAGTSAFSGTGGVTLIASRFANAGATLTAPTTNGALAAGRWAPANATLIAVSEVPTPAALPAGLAMIGMIVARRRRK